MLRNIKYLYLIYIYNILISCISCLMLSRDVFLMNKCLPRIACTHALPKKKKRKEEEREKKRNTTSSKYTCKNGFQVLFELKGM